MFSFIFQGTAFGDFLNQYGSLLWEGTLQTLYMTVVTVLISYLIGLPFGVLLTTTKKGGIQQNAIFNATFGWLLNIVRSLPFYILLFFLMTFTRFLIGIAIGFNAAIVSLSIAAIPFVARMVESSLEEVDHGVIEAAQAMGASNFQIITRVMIRESIPSLLRGLSIITITILGYTAMTGMIGAGGLGDIAYRFGRQRYVDSVMYATIIILIVIVCIIQALFNFFAKKSDKRSR